MRRRLGSILIALAVASGADGRVVGDVPFYGDRGPAQHGHAAYGALLAQMKEKLGGQGVFQASPGGIFNSPAKLRSRIDSKFGAEAIWYPGAGNHEKETAADMARLRAEYATGHGVHKPFV